MDTANVAEQKMREEIKTLRRDIELLKKGIADLNTELCNQTDAKNYAEELAERYLCIIEGLAGSKVTP